MSRSNVGLAPGLSLERKTLLSCRSERVKAVDFHPTEPWVLSALYNGTVTIRNYQTNVLVKTIEVCELPVRTVKFIARKNWILVGSDDLILRVFNYNTLERVTQFTAHSDYIRGLIVHPSRPIVLSCSDDLSIKAWDWEKGWKQVATFEGHSNYVMGIALNPKDSNTFASASLDQTIKIWSLSTLFSGASSSSSGPITVKPNYSMTSGGHDKGVNCIDFYAGSDRPFLATGSDDQTIRIWDYHTKSCVRVLEGHTNNVSAVIFHPQLPFLLSVGEDSTLRIWNAQTFRPEASYNFGMERAWGLACCRAHNAIGIAFDAGSVVFQLGRGDPCASLDPIQGRLVWSRARGSGSAGSHGNEILTGMVRLLDVEGRPIRVPTDGELIPLTPKELGTSDVFPQNLQHSPDGRLVAVWGDGEYVIYSTIGWRNRAFGKGTEVAWAAPGGDIFASRDSNGRVMINRVSAHDHGIPLQGITDCDRVYGGPLLGVSIGGSTLSFFDWTGECLIRTIDVSATAVTWSPDASHVAIQTESSCYILSAKTSVIKSPKSFPSSDEGIEDSLELIDELEQSLKSVCWISGNCFVYLTEENRLAYHVVGGDADESFQLALFDKSHFLLGFLPGEQRVYLTDQDLQVSSYAIMPSLITFQSAVLKAGDISKSLVLIESIPSNYYARLAVFLQRRGYLREALKISPDAHFQFDLAIQLNDLNLARELLKTKMSGEQSKWQELGQVALKSWNLPIAEEALLNAGDLPSLFLLYAAAGDSDGLIQVAKEASKKSGHVNLAFAAYVKAGAYSYAFELLLCEGRAPEAALFARTYGLSVDCVSKAVEMWRLSLKKVKVSASLADPTNNPEKFANVQLGVSGETVGVAPSTPRGRSVSFDGNVSVAGSSSTISLKKPADLTESVKPEELNPIEVISVVTGIGSNVNSVISSFTDELSSEKYSSDTYDDQISLEVNTAGTGTSLEDLDEEDGSKYGNSGLDYIEEMEPDYESSIMEKCTEVQEQPQPQEQKQEQESLLEYEYINVPKHEEQEHDLEEEHYEQFEYPVEPTQSINEIQPEPAEQFEVEPRDDDLLSQLENLHVAESFNESILNVVEDGGDVYEVNEPEYPIDDENDVVVDEQVYSQEADGPVAYDNYDEEVDVYPAKIEEIAHEMPSESVNEHTISYEYPTESVNEHTISYEYPTDEHAISFEYPTESVNIDFARNDDTFEYPNTKKDKGSDDEAVQEPEEIDFGGEGDADGWL